MASTALLKAKAALAETITIAAAQQLAEYIATDRDSGLIEGARCALTARKAEAATARERYGAAVAANLERAQARADRAAARLFAGEVSSSAYAARCARELEEAQADYDLTIGRTDEVT